MTYKNPNRCCACADCAEPCDDCVTWAASGVNPNDANDIPKSGKVSNLTRSSVAMFAASASKLATTADSRAEEYSYSVTLYMAPQPKR